MPVISECSQLQRIASEQIYISCHISMITLEALMSCISREVAKLVGLTSIGRGGTILSLAAVRS